MKTFLVAFLILGSISSYAVCTKEDRAIKKFINFKGVLGNCLSTLYYPSGKTARYTDGEWKYENGKTARYSDGEWRYESGKTARYKDGEWRYESGKTARYTDGKIRYESGKTARYTSGEWRYESGKIARYTHGEIRYENGQIAGNDGCSESGLELAQLVLNTHCDRNDYPVLCAIVEVEKLKTVH